jgi:hypothetical protein
MSEEVKAEKKEAVVAQNGVIVFGGGIDSDRWMADAKAEGYKVTPMLGHAILYKDSKGTK